MTDLKITPETVLGKDSATTKRVAWLEQIEEYVRKAAAEGRTVTLSSKSYFMTPEEMAQRMGVSRATISRRIRSGEIRAVKIGNRNRIPYAEYRRYWRQAMGDLVEFVRDDLREDLFGE